MSHPPGCTTNICWSAAPDETSSSGKPMASEIIAACASPRSAMGAGCTREVWEDSGKLWLFWSFWGIWDMIYIVYIYIVLYIYILYIYILYIYILYIYIYIVYIYNILYYIYVQCLALNRKQKTLLDFSAWPWNLTQGSTARFGIHRPQKNIQI